MDEFLAAEHTQSDSVSSRELQDLMADGTLERDFQYLGSVVPTLIEAIECQETTSVSNHHLIEKLSDLKAFMKTEQKSRTHKEWKTMWTDILSKYEEYFEWTGQPPTYSQKGLNFFRRTRLLDPKQAAELEPTISELQMIPLLKSCPVSQIQSYIDEVGSVTPSSTLCYWQNRLVRWPVLAKAAILSISIPSHSAEVERSFSAYSRVMTKLRTNMSDSTLRTCNMLHFNCII